MLMSILIIELGDTAYMPLITRERGFEPELHRLMCLCFRNKACAEGEDIGVVVLAREFKRFEIAAIPFCGSHMRIAIGDHYLAFTTAAKYNPLCLCVI